MLKNMPNILIDRISELNFLITSLTKYYEYLLFFKNSFFYLKFFRFTNKSAALNNFFLPANSRFVFFNRYVSLKPKLYTEFNGTKASSYNLSRALKQAAFKDVFLSDNFKLKANLFTIFFLLNYSLFNSKFKVNHKFNFYQVIGKKGGVLVVNPLKFLMRWKNSYDFLFNMIFYDLNPLIFSTPLFREHTLSLNWKNNNWTIDSWKFYSPFFIFQANRYHTKTDFFFNQLRSVEVGFFLVTDCFYHLKNLFYFKKNKYFTVGLVNVNNDPDVVSYPIISFFDGYLVQLFFFKLLVFIQKQCLFVKYSALKNIWRQNLIKNVFLR